jgi:2-C-methyl-D-erythritol 4-phosphate cytidylyltransferase
MLTAGAAAETDVIVLAAGIGERLGRGPKAIVRLAGRPLLWWALESVLTNACVRDIIVVANPRAHDATIAVISQVGAGQRIRIITGGATRSESSTRGLAALRPGTQRVAVTDAVRPLAPPGTIDRLSQQLTAAGNAGISAVVPAIPVFDTVRRTRRDGISLGTVDRDELRAVQTPQLLCRQCLEKAMRLAKDSAVVFTDEAGVIEHYGGKVLIVPGDPINRKITVAQDLSIAEALLEMAAPTGARHRVHAAEAIADIGQKTTAPATSRGAG